MPAYTGCSGIRPLYWCCYNNEVTVCRLQTADIEQQGRQRQEKIARFRRRKQLEDSLQDLRLQATKVHADDEITVGIGINLDYYNVD